uniref:OO_Ba0005L10-OO_Ba0081K17.8 protein n=1 Tax=Oryza officinalis TaxID=4535 RepID=D0ABD4_9ORYZ|nr:OO_Ba0005L10-OO_Ba0081K17.8 [Oryza officinalis]
MFGIDPLIEKFIVKAVWPVRSEYGWQWRVVEVASTGSWRKFVAKVREKYYSLAILVQKKIDIVGTGESSRTEVEQAHIVEETNISRSGEEEAVEEEATADVVMPGGNYPVNELDDDEPDSSLAVDAVEENDAVVEEMELENEEYISFVVQGQDTAQWDEETNVPEDWTTISMSRLGVNDGLDAHWRYDREKVQVGQMFHDKGHLQDAVKRWAFLQKREFRVKVSNRTTYDVKCTKPGCPWRVHGYKPQHDNLWVASRIEEHTYLLDNTPLVHRNMTAAFVAQMVYSKVVKKTSLSPFTIMHDVEKEYGYEISYDKAWRGKQKALEMRFGTYEDSYHNLPPLLEVLQARNPGTHMVILDEVNDNGKNVLRRAFWSFGCMIEAFRNCILLLCVDGTFMTGKYRGTILTAIEIDADSHVVPVAFAFVESENTSSWLWFLRHEELVAPVPPGGVPRGPGGLGSAPTLSRVFTVVVWHFIYYAEQIAELPVEEIPQYNWGSAVLAAIYAGLCDACTRNSKASSLTGCPLLLMLWAHERFDIGRPQLQSYASYGVDEMYKSGLEDIDDRPTMESLWTHREPRWVSETTCRVYTQFVADFDQLTPDRVRWTPYTHHDVVERAPHGLAQLCTRDIELWRTTCHLVLDVHIEPYHVQRVLKQFGMYQDYPPRGGRSLAVSLHKCFPPQGDTSIPHQASITDMFAPQPRAAYNSMAEFVEQVHTESNTLLQRLETRPQHVRQDNVAFVLRSFRSRAAALLRRVSCRSATDVEPPRRCQYKEWIDTKKVLSDLTSRVVQLELPEQYRFIKKQFERG